MMNIDLIATTLSFMPLGQVCSILPTIKTRHDLSKKLLKEHQRYLFQTKLDYTIFYITILKEMNGEDVSIELEFQRIIDELR